MAAQKRYSARHIQPSERKLPRSGWRRNKKRWLLARSAARWQPARHILLHNKHHPREKG